MNALEVIQEVEAQGGSLAIEHDDLRVRASAPLSDDLMDALAEQKPAIMIALGAPMDMAVAAILADIRPFLAPALKRLPDDRLLALVNWNIIASWNAAVRAAGERPRRRASGGAR